MTPRMMRRALALVAAAVLATVTLSSCGGDGSDYCNRVRDNVEDKTLENLDLSNTDDVQAFIDEYKALQDDAPDEIRDDFDALIKAYEDPSNASTKLSASIAAIQQYDEDHCDVEYTG